MSYESEIAALRESVHRESKADLAATTAAHNARAQQKVDAANAAAAKIAAKYGKKIGRGFILTNGLNSTEYRPRGAFWP